MRTRIYLLYLGLLSLVIGSCHKKEDKYYPYYGPVSLTQAFAASNTNPDFAAGDKVYFTATFERSAIWTITIKGQTSGTVKTISATGSEINASNSLWDGSADRAPSFLAETVTATLSIAGDPSIYTVNIVIKTTKPKSSGEVIISNFTVNKRFCCGATNANGWPSDWPPIDNTTHTYVYPDGTPYLLWSGTPWQGGGSPYINYMTIEAKNADVNYGTYFPLYPIATRVFFNIMVYGNITKNEWFKVIFVEEGGVNRSIDIKPDWTGWKLLSYNYGETFASGGTVQSDKIKAVTFVLLSTSTVLPGPAVSIAIDHPTFTLNQAYQP